jgi:predicted transcriptional regulator
MKRFQIHLKESQLERLEDIAKAKEEPVARLIRDAVDLYLKAQDSK